MKWISNWAKSWIRPSKTILVSCMFWKTLDLNHARHRCKTNWICKFSTWCLAYGKYEMFGLSVEIPAKCFHSQGCPVNSSCLGSMGAEEAFWSFECLVSQFWECLVSQDLSSLSYLCSQLERLPLCLDSVLMWKDPSSGETSAESQSPSVIHV